MLNLKGTRTMRCQRHDSRHRRSTTSREVLHNMWNLKVASYPAGKELKNTIIDMKKEIKMSFLKDVFQTADEIKQNEEKFKSAVEASFHQLDTLVRPYLKFWKGWLRPLPSIRSKSATAAPCRRLQKRRQHLRRGPMCSSKTKTALPAPTGKAAIETGIVCVNLSRPYNTTKRSI